MPEIYLDPRVRHSIDAGELPFRLFVKADKPPRKPLKTNYVVATVSLALSSSGAAFAPLEEEEPFPEEEAGASYWYEAIFSAASDDEVTQPRVEELLQQLGATEVQVPGRAFVQLDLSTREIRAAPNIQRAAGINPVRGGRDVVVGVVDFGCDFAHPNFRNRDGKSRIIALWDQNDHPAVPGAPGTIPAVPFNFGREFDNNAIDAALTAVVNGAHRDPYTALGYDPHANYYLRQGTTEYRMADPIRTGAHGTHVLDIAAGNGRGTDQAGVAPAADIIFVQARMREADTVIGQGEVPPQRIIHERWLDAADVVSGVAYIFEKAKTLGKAAVVNISLNTNLGPHDSDDLNFAVPTDYSLRPAGRAMAVSAGNFFGADLHVSGSVSRLEPVCLNWTLPPGCETIMRLEAWYESSAAVPAEEHLRPVVLCPDGSLVQGPQPGTYQRFAYKDAWRGAILGSTRLRNLGNNRFLHWIGVEIYPPAAAGAAEEWGLNLLKDGGGVVDVDAWIERDDHGQAFFSGDGISNLKTLGRMACGNKAIGVGSYYGAPRDPGQRRIAAYSASGPRRTGPEANNQQPFLSAPGDGVHAARSKQGHVWTVKSGTSMAAPHVSGTVALLLEARPELGSDAIKTHLRETCRGNLPDLQGFELAPPPEASAPWDPVNWDRRYGHGRIDATAVLT